MNDRWKQVWIVTRWEFNRFFKWKDVVKGILYMAVFGAIGAGISLLFAADTIEVPDIAVAEYGAFTPEDFEAEEIRFLNRTGSTEGELEAGLADGSLDGVLRVVSADSAVIRMENEKAWLYSLRGYLQEQRTGLKLREFAIDEEVYATLEEELVLHTEFDRGSGSSVADKAIAGISIFLVLMAVFMGFAYQFTAITAEKQQRITEQVISAIDPQTWIDGKILGITGIGLMYVLIYGGMSLVGAILLVQFVDAPLGEALSLLNPPLVILFLVLAFMGILMWNSFLAAVAATITDPNSSERASLMFLPMLPVLFAFFTLANPESVVIQVLGVFPLTSYAVLPARMVLSQVHWWEPALALILLAGTIWLFRIGAGKIFSTAMMMYGKEPSIREIAFWLRKSSNREFFISKMFRDR